ncbi:hypothetical protein B1R94_11705 [Mycolicibacterium litorale]|nr:hypothetical protein B1R94_11705 [Mycolicibacterium litorale]
MRIRPRSSSLLAAAICTGAVLLSPVLGAPTGSAATCPGGTILDPTTGTCWSQNAPSNSYGGSGNIPCLPGRIGLCLGALQNTPIPGAALKPVPLPARRREGPGRKAALPRQSG